jgi:pimeloyl-ACP methyl ester carboxylesterase
MLIFHLIALAIGLAGLVAISTIGAKLIELAHPPRGRFVEVSGGKLHVVELAPAQPVGVDEPAIVLLHGASGNLEDMRLAFGDTLAQRWRVILIDRPGRGWSDLALADSSPARQAALIHEALARLGVKRAVLVGHSWAGALATAFALDYPRNVAGLVLIAPATHPWEGGISWYYTLTTAPLLGPLFAHTLALPIGWLLIRHAAASVFAPQPLPPDYLSRTTTPLILRPGAFLSNARDVADLKDNLKRQAPRYHEIKAPTVIIAGDQDLTVSLKIHAQALAAQIPHARLEILPGVGHMPHHARPDRVAAAIAEVVAASQLE